VNRAAAKAWLSRETAATSEPRLGSEDLDALLDEAAGVSAGAEAEFTLPMLNRAASRGWVWKANAAAEYHGRESEIYQHCVERERHYRARATGGGAVARSADPVSVEALR